MQVGRGIKDKKSFRIYISSYIELKVEHHLPVGFITLRLTMRARSYAGRADPSV